MKGHAPDWQVRCCTCGLTFDAADLRTVFAGKVVGNEYKLRWCQQCRWVRWLSVEHRPKDMRLAEARCDLATHARENWDSISLPWGLFLLGWFFATAQVALFASLICRILAVPATTSVMLLCCIEVVAGVLLGIRLCEDAAVCKTPTLKTPEFICTPPCKAIKVLASNCGISRSGT